MELDDKKYEQCKKIHERARYLRGRFLNYVAVIERDIAVILTDYFCTICPDKREIFFKDVVTAPFFSLKCKKDVLIKIVKKDYPIYWDDKKNILNDFDEIIRFRNKLAHSIVDVSESALTRPVDQGIGFVDWEEGKPITEEQFQDWELKATAISSCLDGVKQLLPFKQKKV